MVHALAAHHPSLLHADVSDKCLNRAFTRGRYRADISHRYRPDIGTYVGAISCADIGMISANKGGAYRSDIAGRDIGTASVADMFCCLGTRNRKRIKRAAFSQRGSFFRIWPWWLIYVTSLSVMSQPGTRFYPVRLDVSKVLLFECGRNSLRRRQNRINPAVPWPVTALSSDWLFTPLALSVFVDCL